MGHFATAQKPHTPLYMKKYEALNIDLKRVYRTATKNSIRRNIGFALTRDEFADICERAQSRCELTGIAFDFTKANGKWERRPWAASLDRIDHTSGYSPENCRLICVAVNIAMNTWGEETLKLMAKGLLEFDAH